MVEDVETFDPLSIDTYNKLQSFGLLCNNEEIYV